jgi:LysM repeat protein
MRRFIIKITIISLVFSIFAMANSRVNAQTSSASDLINAVNALRSNNGLTAYQVDSGLMASAQQHAEYMSQIGEITHLRADGTTPSDLGFIENIAGGLNLNVQVVVNSMWTDTDHWNTMVGITYGSVGAGVAVNNGYVYYVLQVKRIQTGLAGQPTPNYNATADPNVINAVITNTPQIDNSIIHEVLDGQSLWSIALAYNITIADIIRMNNLLPTPVIFPGERLLVRLAPTATLTPTVTNTPIPPTRTNTPTVTPKTPTKTPTLRPTATATPKILFSFENIDPVQRKSIGLGMTVICGIGLLMVFLIGFVKKEK